MKKKCDIYLRETEIAVVRSPSLTSVFLGVLRETPCISVVEPPTRLAPNYRFLSQNSSIVWYR